MLSWPEGFIKKLSPTSNPRFAIRYDHRDTGRSTSSLPDGQARYILADLCNDALAILDHLKIEAAHFVGFSLGGCIAWMIAGGIAPKRVKGLSLLSTSPIGVVPLPEDDLPPLNSEVAQQWAKIPMPQDWDDTSQVATFLSEVEKCSSYMPRNKEDEEDSTRLAEKTFERARFEGNSVQSIFNTISIAQSRWLRELFKGVKQPTLILHGRNDRNIPLPHAKALNKDIEGSKLVVIDEMAHELPRRAWDRVASETLEITK